MSTTNKPNLRTWKSTKERMALKSSAFTPKGVALGGRQMLGDHMQSHYRRIRTAGPAVDTAEPSSMTSHIRVKDKKKGREEPGRTSLIGSTLSLDESELLTEQQLNGYDTFMARADRLNMTHRFGSPASSTSRLSDLVDRRHINSAPLQRHIDIPFLQHTSGDSLSADCYVNSHRYPHSLKQRYVLRSCDRHRNGGDQMPPWKPSGSAVRHSTGAIPSAPAVPRCSQKRSKKDRLVKLGEKEEDGRKLETVDVGESLDECTFQSDNLALLTNILHDGENGHDEQAVNALDSPNSHSEKQEFSSRISVQLKQELTSASLSSVQPVVLLHQQAMAEKSQKRATEETELRYLQFVSDVTTDILTRGVYSNLALQLLFQSHVEKRKGELDECVLYQKLDQLKLDLGFQ